MTGLAAVPPNVLLPTTTSRRSTGATRSRDRVPDDLIRHVARQRQSYTGERYEYARTAIASAWARLKPTEQAIVSRHVLSQQRHHNTARSIPPPVRDALLPDAVNAAQQALEAAVFTALNTYPTLDDHWTEVDPFDRPWVQPEQDRLTLHTGPTVMAPTLVALLPRVHDEHLVGVPGLRVRAVQHGGGGIVLADDPRARVRIAMPPGTWQASIDAAIAATDLDPQAVQTRQLTDLEQAALGNGRVNASTALGSALLRRLRVVGDTHWAAATPAAPGLIRLSWVGGRDAREVAHLLADPLLGLPDATTVTSADGTAGLHAQIAGQSVTVTLRHRRVHPEASHAWR